MAKLTPWFSGGTRPARVGVYQVRWYEYIGYGAVETRTSYSYWSGLRWSTPANTARGTLRHLSFVTAPEMTPEWRGRGACAEKGKPKIIVTPAWRGKPFLL